MLPVNPDPLILPLSDLVAAVYQYLNLAFLLDATGVYFAVRDLSRHGGSLVRATAAAGDVDAAISIASFRAGRSDWTRPDLQNAEATSELTEPASSTRGRCGAELDRVATRTRCARDRLQHVREVDVSQNCRRQCGSRADDQHMPGARVPCASVPRAQLHREGGRSPGGQELLHSRKSRRFSSSFARATDPAPHLFLLDELFRGTNAVERIAAGQAVLQELLVAAAGRRSRMSCWPRRMTGNWSTWLEAFDAYHFGDSIGPDGLTFDHRLQHGPATTRNAIALLRLHGAPETLLTQAVTTAEMLDRQRGTTLVPR